MHATMTETNHSKQIKVLASAEELQKRVEALAQQINKDYDGLEIDIVCSSNGATVFTADLCRLIALPVRLHLIAFNSYPSATASGEVQLTLDVTEPLQNRHVLIMEGIIISGRTPLYIINLLRLRQPASIELCAIAMKPKQLAVELQVKYHLYDFDEEWDPYHIKTVDDKISSKEKEIMTI